MKKLLIGSMIIGFASLAYPQSSNWDSSEFELKNITLSPLNIDYLFEVGKGTVAQKVLNLEKKVANFDLRTSPAFDGTSKTYEFSFSQPDGMIRATFDKAGKILSSQERFKNILFPKPIRNRIYQAYPGWVIEGNTYVVTYSHDGVIDKMYKVRIGKGNLQKRLKVDDQGNIF